MLVAIKLANVLLANHNIDCDTSISLELVTETTKNVIQDKVCNTIEFHVLHGTYMYQFSFFLLETTSSIHTYDTMRFPYNIEI